MDEGYKKTDKKKPILYKWIGITMSILPKLIYIFSAILIKIPMALFTEIEKNPKIYIEIQRTPEGKVILNKYKARVIVFPDLKLY